MSRAENLDRILIDSYVVRNCLRLGLRYSTLRAPHFPLRGMFWSKSGYAPLTPPAFFYETLLAPAFRLTRLESSPSCAHLPLHGHIFPFMGTSSPSWAHLRHIFPFLKRMLRFIQSGLPYASLTRSSTWHLFNSTWHSEILAGLKCGDQFHSHLSKAFIPWIPCLCIGNSRLSKHLKHPRVKLLLMEEILHHLGCIKPCREWDKLPTSTG